MTPSDITILGAGVAGLTAGLALARRGWRVRVLEQAPALADLGAGLQVSPNGLAVLRALGLEEALMARTLASEGAVLRDGLSGADVARIPLSDRYRLTHRVALIGILAEAAREAGVDLRLGARIEDLTLGAPIRLHLAGGERVEAGLLIGADGIKSKLRRALEPAATPRFTGQVAWRALLPDRGDTPDAAHVFMGPGRHVVRYPVRAEDGTRLINLAAVQERESWAEEGWSQEDDPANLRAAFADFAPEVTELLSRVERTYLWGLFLHPVARQWGWAARGAEGEAAALVIGDAAHATLPFLAQGANMALEDAWLLADCLEAEASAREAFGAFQAARAPRVTRIVGEASANARRYHLSGIKRHVGFAGLRLISAAAPGVLTRRYDWLYKADVTQGAAL